MEMEKGKLNLDQESNSLSPNKSIIDLSDSITEENQSSGNIDIREEKTDTLEYEERTLITDDKSVQEEVEKTHVEKGIQSSEQSLIEEQHKDKLLTDEILNEETNNDSSNTKEVDILNKEDNSQSINPGYVLATEIELLVDQLLEPIKSDEQILENSELISLLTGSAQSSDITESEMDVEMEDDKYESMDGLSLKVLKSDDSQSECHFFYNKDCINFKCSRSCKNFVLAPVFCLNFFKISKIRNRPQYICEECFDICHNDYKKLCLAFMEKEPLIHVHIPRKEDYVEIIDSSEDEDGDSSEKTFEEPFDETTIEMFKRELVDTINKVLCDVSVQNQLSWTRSIWEAKIEKIKNDQLHIKESLNILQRKSDNMHNSLYSMGKIKLRPVAPLDLNASIPDQSELNLPPLGEVVRPPIEINGIYYAAKNKVIASWVPCKVAEQHVTTASGAGSQLTKNYKIKFLKTKLPLVKVVSAKHMAYFEPPSVRLQIGARVIALFDTSVLTRGKGKMTIPSAFYPGIVAEPLKSLNNHRYLIFFDDGYAQYVVPKNVRLVCQSSENVWDDVHVGSREFIHTYLTQYQINRPMVQTQKGQSMVTESNGKWIYAKVMEVDCSLVQMQFQSQHMKTEWIYRGSTRLGPVYREQQKSLQNTPAPSTAPAPVTRASRRMAPFIRYTQDEETPAKKLNRSSTDEDNAKKSLPQTEGTSEVKSTTVRAVARKSVSKPDSSTLVLPQSAITAAPVKLLNNETIFVEDDNRPKGKVIFYTAKKNRPPRTYTPHVCSSTCLIKVSHNLNAYSPLAKPLLSGWERIVYIQTRSRKHITYRGPCGKQLRKMSELHHYLRATNCPLNVDNFDFNCDINSLAEYVIESTCIVKKNDLSNGKEKMPIECVNYYDNTMPPACVYSTERIPTEGVNLNLDKNFLTGCDCEGDCSDKSKCSCWQLTLSGSKYSDGSISMENIGYTYKRLLDPYSAGIYECNANCKCSSNCINRVVQHPLNIKLQVFKTSNRGWGIRCINDVPKGSFICIYAGHLLTEQKANEGGVDAGDEYFAELDYIESIERVKEGYESDVPSVSSDPESENSLSVSYAIKNTKEDNYEDDEDVDFNPRVNVQKKVVTTRQKSKNSKLNDSPNNDDDEAGNLPERRLINFEPNTMMENNEDVRRFKSVRKLFGKDEDVYVMDAKITGNIGRYFNHSCSPNLFVQNVFVDTHDLRFPWIAFFSNTNIRAGTELTWNYNYEVGVVPGKVLYCECGAPNCRGRLL